MDAFDFGFETNSLLTDDTNSEHSSLDWTAFQPTPPTVTSSPFSAACVSSQEDAVAPEDRLNLMTPQQDEGDYLEIEHFFRALNQQQEQLALQQPHMQSQQDLIEAVHMDMPIPDPSRTDLLYIEPAVHHPVYASPTGNDPPPVCLPAPLVPRLTSSRSQCYHKLPDHAVKLMQDWYNAHLDDPYPRSPDKKRFITEGNITAQQCRSWFANRRQRLKHVKRNQPRTSSSSSRAHRLMPQKIADVCAVDEQPKLYEHCYHCQQPPLPSSSCFPLPLTPTTTTTLNVVINQQTVEQLIHNSLRKLFNPAII